MNRLVGNFSRSVIPRRFLLNKNFNYFPDTHAPITHEYASKHHGGSGRMWAILCGVVVAPALVVAFLNFRYREHHHHRARPEFVAFDYLRLRTKPYPWGDGQHSLFHNAHTNALPTGYETSEEGHGHH